MGLPLFPLSTQSITLKCMTSREIRFALLRGEGERMKEEESTFENVNCCSFLRFMKSEMFLDGDAEVGVLMIRDAGPRDNGEFHCEVEDRELASVEVVKEVPGVGLRSVDKASIRVDVVTRPEIEVYPRLEISRTFLRLC